MNCCFKPNFTTFTPDSGSEYTNGVMFFPTNANSDISGYKLIVNSNSDPSYDNPAVDIPTGAITGTAQLLASLSTSPGIFIGNLGTINITTIGNIKRLSGTGTAEFYFEIYHRDSAGTETLIGTSNATQQVISPTYAEFSANALMSNGNFDVTDRVVLKFYANRIAGGSDPSYNFQFGGTNPVRTIIPAQISNIVVEDKTFEEVIDLTLGSLTYSFRSGYDMKLLSITNVFNSPTTTITVNAAPYTIGTPISMGDLINVTVSTASVIRLNLYKI